MKDLYLEDLERLMNSPFFEIENEEEENIEEFNDGYTVPTDRNRGNK